MISLTTLKSWFSTGMKPTGAQFAQWMDSFWHKSEKIGADVIEQTEEKQFVSSADKQNFADKYSQEEIDDMMAGITAPESTFAQDIAVSLSGGKTFGKYASGQTIPAAGKSAEQVLRLAAIESIYPTYTVPTAVLTQSATATGEVGEAVSNTVTLTYTKNNAGDSTLLRIEKSGTLVSETTEASPYVVEIAMTRTTTNQPLVGKVNYDAGAAKLIVPDNIPDTRPAAIRTTTAPQAAENGFTTSALSFIGYYKVFYGAAAANPTTSALVRALPSSQLSNAGNSITLNTGTTHNTFAIAVPSGKTVSLVMDLDVNANVTGNYVLQSLTTVNDAGGNAVSGYKVYVMTNAVPYSANHRHQITLS